MRTSLFLLSLLLAGVSCSSCDIVDGGFTALERGQRLDVVTVRAAQPATRQEFARLGTFATPGYVVVFDPRAEGGPEIVRTIRVPGHLTNDAQIDSDGFLWIATPTRNSASLRVTYVVDPFSGAVERVLSLPETLRATAGLVVGTDFVYLRAWRDGRSGGVGKVSRRCTADPSACTVTLMTELGDVGSSTEQGLRLDGSTLYSWSNPNSVANRESVDTIDTTTGRILRSAPFGGNAVMTNDFIWSIGFYEPNVNTIVKLNKRTLEVVARIEVPGEFEAQQALIAIEGDNLYVTGYLKPTVDVRSASTLALVRTLDVSGSGGATGAFGIVAPGVLVLSHRAFAVVDGDAVRLGTMPVDAQFSLALRLAEGLEQY